MSILGIDLGTTNSCCAIWQNDEPVLIPNRLGQILTPSVVGVDEQGEVIVGQIAKERLISHSDKTVAVFKRLMGSDHKVHIGHKQFNAIELSALVLRSLKEDAEQHLNQTITEAVISVPAYFNENQRQATKMAGELAGLKVDRLINEPTAAAMAYGVNQNKESTVMVLDLGGGTFDVSILEFFDTIMEVHASTGDNFLGGEDFVEAMVERLLSDLAIKADSLSPLERQMLYQQMEVCKRQVSAKPEQHLELTLNGHVQPWTFHADWMQKTCNKLLIKVQKPIGAALRDAELAPEQIDQVLLVGGSTRLAMFRSTVGQLFKRIPSSHIDPDTVIAKGAAIQGALKGENNALDDVVLTDVSAYTLGTATHNPDGHDAIPYFLPIIERNTTVPVSIVTTLYTVHDNQSRVDVEVYQGEHRFVDKNILLGNVSVKVPKAPAGEQAIDVRYSYDMNGLLEVEVTVKSTKEVIRKVIERAPGVLDEQQKLQSLAKLAKLKFHPRDQEENRALIAKGERLYQSSLGEIREYIGQLMADFDRVLASQRNVDIAKQRKKLNDIFEQMDVGQW